MYVTMYVTMYVIAYVTMYVKIYDFLYVIYLIFIFFYVRIILKKQKGDYLYEHFKTFKERKIIGDSS